MISYFSCSPPHICCGHIDVTPMYVCVYIGIFKYLSTKCRRMVHQKLLEMAWGCIFPVKPLHMTAAPISPSSCNLCSSQLLKPSSGKLSQASLQSPTGGCSVCSPLQLASGKQSSDSSQDPERRRGCGEVGVGSAPPSELSSGAN